MKEKFFINARIIDPSQNIDEVGGLIVDNNGKIKALGKSVKKGNIPTKIEKIDLKGKILIPGIVDMKVFIGEPGYEYKENFRTLSSAALESAIFTKFFCDFSLSWKSFIIIITHKRK